MNTEEPASEPSDSRQHGASLVEPRPFGVDDIALGRWGLRAGWSVALFIVLFLSFEIALGFTTGGVFKLVRKERHIAAQSHKQQAGQSAQPREITPLQEGLSEGITLAAVVAATFVMAKLERRKMSVFGIGRARFPDVFAGAFWGIAALSLLVATLCGMHLLVFDGRVLRGTTIYKDGLLWLLIFLIVGLFEEYSIRGFLQFTMTRGFYGVGEYIAPDRARAWAFWIAAVLTSIAFGALHLMNPGENRFGIFMVFLAGILFSYALWRTGSLWWSIGFHTTWDWAQTFLYGVPDSGGLFAGRLFHTHATGNPVFSGGSDGPEGSVLVVPTLLLVAVIIRFTTRRGQQPSLAPGDITREPALSIR
jgi:membrane protease YdiL (CAAX protease family)